MLIGFTVVCVLNVVCVLDLCLSCGSTDGVSEPHPLFEGGLCMEHRVMFQEWFFKYDEVSV